MCYNFVTINLVVSIYYTFSPRHHLYSLTMTDQRGKPPEKSISKLDNKVHMRPTACQNETSFTMSSINANPMLRATVQAFHSFLQVYKVSLTLMLLEKK